jgi:photosystem II stability/assembly factor-like uncharacterized protein
LMKYDGTVTEHVGEYKRDYMGLTAAYDGVFYTSGHTSEIDDVGIQKSVDKGKTWKTINYLGKDFHDIAVSYADPKVIYALSTPPNQFLAVSRDAGVTWTEIEPDIRSIFSLGADHQHPNRLYAATLYGLFASEDYGKTWELKSLEDVSIVTITDDPVHDGTIYVSAAKRGLLKSTDDGKTWQDIHNGLPDAFDDIVALHVINPRDAEHMYLMTKSGKLFSYDKPGWSEMHLEMDHGSSGATNLDTDEHEPGH